MSYQARKMQYLMGQQGQERADAGLNFQGLAQAQQMGEGARQFNEGLGMNYDQIMMDAINQFIGAQGQDFQQQAAEAGLNEDFLNNAFGRNSQIVANALGLFMPPQPIDTYSPAQMEQNRAINQAQLDQNARRSRMAGLGQLAGGLISAFNPVSGILGSAGMNVLGGVFGGGRTSPPGATPGFNGNVNSGNFLDYYGGG